MATTTVLGVSQSIQDRIAAARARQAELEAQQRQQINQPKIEQFTFLLGKLFGDSVIADLGARVEWQERPVLVIPWNGQDKVLVALPKPTGHVGWTLGSVELFEQKYAPSASDALDLLLVALDTA
jgi:hypothetical protein